MKIAGVILLVGAACANPMSSTTLEARMSQGAWDGQLSPELRLAVNLAQGWFRGMGQMFLPPVTLANECSPDHAPVEDCPEITGWEVFEAGDSCYYWDDTVRDLDGAREACAGLDPGMDGTLHLPVINDYDESNAITAMLEALLCEGDDCDAAWAAQYRATHGSNYATYEVPCAGRGLLQLYMNPDDPAPCNIIYPGLTAFENNDQENCEEMMLRTICEFDKDADPSDWKEHVFAKEEVDDGRR